MGFFSSFCLFVFLTKSTIWIFLGLVLQAVLACSELGVPYILARYTNRDCLPQIIFTPVIFFFLKKNFEYSQMIILEGRKMKGK